LVTEDSMPRAFRDEERKLIRGRLIDAGKRLINRAGTKGLTVDDAARDARISKGSFYSFFPSREDYLLSVFESWEEQYRGALFRDVLESPGSPTERLQRFFLGAIALIEREPGLARLGYGEIERIKEALPPGRIAAHQAADGRAMSEAIAAWIAGGIIDPAAVGALPGIAAALFAIALHKDDFPEGSFEPTARILAEALARRLAPAEGGVS
jgi:AcrR family transcriptional regulator